MEEPTVQPMEPQGEAQAGDVEKKHHVMINDEASDASLKEAPPMTIKRFIVLFALSNLYVSAGTAAIFLGAGICTLLKTLVAQSNVASLYGGRHRRYKFGGMARSRELSCSRSDFTSGRFHFRFDWPTIRCFVGPHHPGCRSNCGGDCPSHRRGHRRFGSCRRRGWLSGDGRGSWPARTRTSKISRHICRTFDFSGLALRCCFDVWYNTPVLLYLANFEPNCIPEILGDGPHGSRSCILVSILSCSSFFITHLHGQILSGFPGEKLSLALTILEFSCQSPESRSFCLACNGEVTTSKPRCDPEF